MHFKLSQLLGLVESVVYSAFEGKRFMVIAETLDVKNYPERQYCFLTLSEKEGKSTIAKAEAVIWRQNYNIISQFEKETGTAFSKNLQLLLTVSIEYSAQWGFRLQVWNIDSGYTIGLTEQTRQQTLQRLINENPEVVKFEDGQFYSINKQLDAAIVLQKIALITAPDSDGQRDFKHELTNNLFGYKFQITEFLTQIQGQHAEAGILKQLELIKTSQSHFDAVVLVRGGGSAIDLSVFDSYELSLTIASFPIPVICGLGHERNVSITDLMCYRSVKTPTKAAAYLIENNHNFEETILANFNVLYENMMSLISEQNENLNEFENFISNQSSTIYQGEHHKLNLFEKTVKHLNPENILAKGYAIIRKNGEVISDPLLIRENDVIETTIKNHTIESLVTKLKLTKAIL